MGKEQRLSEIGILAPPVVDPYIPDDGEN